MGAGDAGQGKVVKQRYHRNGFYTMYEIAVANRPGRMGPEQIFFLLIFGLADALNLM
jgi:hypothetical protein